VGRQRARISAQRIANHSVINWANFVSQVFNGLVLGALLALISSGLTIIYGTLGVLNLAHGAMFMLGGYAGWVAYTYTDSFIVAVIAGSSVRHAGRRGDGAGGHPLLLPGRTRINSSSPSASASYSWRPCAFSSAACRNQCRRRPLWSGSPRSAFMFYPTYRLALLGIVAVALIALYIALYRTRIGMIVRAGIEDSVMVDSLGIDVYKVFMLVFGIGAMAAGFAGIVNAPVVSIAPDVGEAILVQTFVVVVIGGVGSFPGAVLGGLIAGEIISITSMFNPGYSYVMLFVAMTLVLVLRPYGLLGAAGRE
jgi:branched-chain amino acid transport system permease protein